MNLVKTIKIEMSDWSPGQQLGDIAVVGDSGARILEFELLEGGREWTIPEGVRPALGFRSDGGYSGEYDTMPDGTDAFEIEGNRVRMRLVDQITAAAGSVRMMLVLRSEQMEQASSFPFFVSIAQGIPGVEPLPKAYYWLSSLGEINRELERLDSMLKEMDVDTVVAAAREAKQAAQDARAFAESVDAEQIAAAIAGRGDDIYIEDGHVYLLSGEKILGEGAELPKVGGLTFDGGFVDEEGYLHLTLDGVDIEGFVPFFVGAGGGSAASVMMLRTGHVREFSVLEQDEQCIIPFTWSSFLDGENTGSGFMEWTVNGSRVAMAAVDQGDAEFDVRPYLAAGAQNSVVLKITDVYGTMRTLSFSITVTAYGLGWNLGETALHEGALSVRLNPTGAGEKLLRVAVDGEVVSETTVTTTGRTVTVEIPQQIHGAHMVTAWVEVPEHGIDTERLVHMGVWLTEGISTPVVAVLTPEVEVTQYGTASIRWFVMDPSAESARVELKVDGVNVNILENVGREVQTWAYKAGSEGEHVLSIHCGAGAAAVDLNVMDPGYEISPVSAGLELDLDPAGHSNAEAGREFFGYVDGGGVNHPLIFSGNFDWVGGGFREDEEGVTAFVIKRGCSVTLDRSLFGSDCRVTGKHLKLIFKSENVRNYDASLMECKSGNVGLVVQAQAATVSSQLESMQVLYCEGRKVEMDVCIQAEGEDSLAWIDLKGIQSCPPVRYGATDTWEQSNPVPLVIGSEDADVWVYRMKVWGNSLNRYEVLDEYTICAGSPDEMARRYLRNDIYNTDGSINPSKVAKNNPDLRVIRLWADRMTTGKEDNVTADLELTYTAGGDRHHLIAQGVTFKAQGTSSLEYILAALNLDVDLSTATAFMNGLGEPLTAYAMTEDSIPVSYFNLKANVASSDSCNNVCLAEEYNRWNPYVCDPRKQDSRVRDTVEGHPCAVFFTSTADAAIEVGARTVQPGETILYFVGDMNNSKKNFAVFGQDNDRYPMQCCVEVMNNTELPCRFKEVITDDEKWKDGNFEFRFPKAPTEEMKAAFMEMQSWVVSTDRDAATGAAFDVPVELEGKIYAGDTADYRAAKFRSQFSDHFVPEAMDFHFLFTDENCMTDNRAKNLFLCYEWVEELQDYRWSVRCDYDNDTALGNDNSGGLTFGYGLEDTDMAGDSWVFNAHDSVLWCNVRDLRSEELRSLHIRLAGQGAWDAGRRSECFRAYQSTVCEALRTEDMHNKYFLPWINHDAAAYAGKCLGTKEDQREQFLRYQQVYKGSQYCDISNRSDAISMRVTVETARNGDMTITTYSDLYIVVMYGNGGRVVKRVKRNTPTLIECPTDSLGDTETYIFAAGSLTAISSLAQMKPKFVLANTAQRLQELSIGSGEVGYRNLNLSQVGVGSNRMLRLLDLRGCPNLVTALDLSGLTGLEQFLASGSGITGVSFARGCPLKEIRLPGISSLTALELKDVEEFLMDPGNLTLLRMEDCPGIDSLSICKGAPGLERGRLTGVDWIDSDGATLMHLAGLKGYDGQGRPTEYFVLTGSCHVQTITQGQIDVITAAFPELVLTYEQIVESVTVTFRNWDGTALHEQIVPVGGDAVNPITTGAIRVPVKPSSVEKHYKYSGWDKSLSGISVDTDITALFAASDRYYTVRYWYDKAENDLAQDRYVIAHGDSPFDSREPEPEDGSFWMGWDAVASDVVSDMNIHAVYIVPRLPDSVPEQFDYLYSDDPADRSAFTMEEFMGVLEYGAGKTYFQVGDRIKMVIPQNDVIADPEIVLSVHGFRHYRLADGTGDFAGVVFGMLGVMNTKQRMNPTAINAGGWPDTWLRTFLNQEVFTVLPQQWKALIRPVQVRSLENADSGAVVTTEERLFLMSLADAGYNAAIAPYSYEVDADAETVRLPVYTDYASRRKRTYNGQGAESYWWVRTPDAGAEKYLILPESSYVYADPANTANGVCWLCCMGGALE